MVFDLDLSDNQISEIEDLAFTGMLQLRELYLRNNRLNYIPNSAFKGAIIQFSCLFEVSSYEILILTCFSTGLVALEYLDLSQNALESVDNKTTSIIEDCRSLKTVSRVQML